MCWEQIRLCFSACFQWCRIILHCTDGADEWRNEMPSMRVQVERRGIIDPQAPNRGLAGNQERREVKLNVMHQAGHGDCIDRERQIIRIYAPGSFIPEARNERYN
ncbi:unnamed protein product [Orchesella dallaii]|uniref:Uncharacterized protein n=1 Tax=Orchesella dallaii TaxID=48710 RepID=A0ABP1RZK0_9HEXA